MNVSRKEQMMMVFIHKSTWPRCFPKAFWPRYVSALILQHHFMDDRGDFRWLQIRRWLGTTWWQQERKHSNTGGQCLQTYRSWCAKHKHSNIDGQRLQTYRPRSAKNHDCCIWSICPIKYCMLFLSCKCDLGGPALCQGVIVTLKFWYKRKLVAWNLEKYATTITT